MKTSSAKTEEIRLRLEPQLKKEALAVLSELGIDVSTAVRMFLRQVVQTKGVPFDIHVPNKATAAAMLEAREISKRNKDSK